MEKKRRVVIDCDPGVDDAVALIMAMKHLEVLGICAVGGNTGLSNTLRNALFITELAERSDIPVYAGYDYPMFSKPERAEYVHGKGGLGNIEVGELAKKSENAHAVDFIIDTFMNNKDVCLITLGPLTNVAQAVLKEPRLSERIPEILCMGGSVTAGNYSAAAEFNIYADPEAAKIVFESGIKIKLVGLNLCRQNSVTESDVEEIRKIGNKVADFVADTLKFSLGIGIQVEVCDACAVSWYVNDKIITKSLPMHVDVETKGEFTRGMTVCDYRNYICTEPTVDIGRTKLLDYKNEKENCEVAMEFDRELFMRTLIETLRMYG